MAKIFLHHLSSLTDDELLRLRLCDLNIDFTDSAFLQEAAYQLLTELKLKKILVKPNFWLSTEWFCPDGFNGIAVPFYLAHPRLIKLHQNMGSEAEGSSFTECLKLLRHEMGHVMDNAFTLRRRRERISLFGRSSINYPAFYSFVRYSRKFVRHLEDCYAQSHPAEDFAETFAVWLDPSSNWAKRYKKWPALPKLQYIDQLMQELAATKPLIDNHQEIEPLYKNKKTLYEHYRRLQQTSNKKIKLWDFDLGQTFRQMPGNATMPLSNALKEWRYELRTATALQTGLPQYRVDQMIIFLIKRAHTLDLYINKNQMTLKQKLSYYLSSKVTRFINDGGHLIRV